MTVGTYLSFVWCRGRPTDIYALGACLFTFVYGRIPFSAPTVYQLFQVVQTEPLRFPEEPLVSDDLKDLLSQMLTKVRNWIISRYHLGAETYK